MVLPPSAVKTVIAFSKALKVIMSIGQMSFSNIYPEPVTFTNRNLGSERLNLNRTAVKPRPRRRLADSDADGLDILIQKTKAIGLRHGEEGLVCFSMYCLCEFLIIMSMIMSVRSSETLHKLLAFFDFKLMSTYFSIYLNSHNSRPLMKTENTQICLW